MDFNPLAISAEIILAVSACVILLAALFTQFEQKALKAFSICALILSAIIKICLPESVDFFGIFVFDSVAKYSSVLLDFVAIYFLLSNARADEGEFFALFLFMMTCFHFMVSSKNLIMLFISLEGSSLALYSLIAFKKKAVDAALKYFCYGMLGSAFFAMGSAMFYYDTASIELDGLINFSNASILAFSLIGSTILFKLSLAPMHLWLKDVYKLSNSSLAGFISVAPKIAMSVLAFRFISTFSEKASTIVLIIAAFSMLYASYLSLKQKNAKDMLVYSSISHSSFAFAALAVPSLAVSGFLYYFATFAFVNIAIFMFLGAFKNCDYKEFAGQFKARPLLSILLCIMLLNLAAIPPFGVFFAKVSIINIALSHSVCVAICMALSSIIMLFAYLRFIKSFFIDAEAKFIYFNNSQKFAFILALIASFVASFVIDIL